MMSASDSPAWASPRTARSRVPVWNVWVRPLSWSEEALDAVRLGVTTVETVEGLQALPFVHGSGRFRRLRTFAG